MHRKHHVMLSDLKQTIIPVFYRITSCNFQDVQGPKWFSRILQALEFEKIPGLLRFQEAWKPDIHFELQYPIYHAHHSPLLIDPSVCTSGKYFWKCTINEASGYFVLFGNNCLIPIYTFLSLVIACSRCPHSLNNATDAKIMALMLHYGRPLTFKHAKSSVLSLGLPTATVSHRLSQNLPDTSHVPDSYKIAPEFSVNVQLTIECSEWAVAKYCPWHILGTVFPDNQLHWYWQHKITITQNINTHKI